MSHTGKNPFSLLDLLRRFGFHPLGGTVIPPKEPNPGELQPAGEPLPAVPEPGNEIEK